MSDERALLVAAADRLFADFEREGGAGSLTLEERWATLDESGLGSVLVSERRGGSGVSYRDAGALLERAGWFAVDAPLAETVLGRGLLDRADVPIPDGMLGIAIDCKGEFARRTDGAWEFSGRLSQVPWGCAVGHVLVPMHTDTEEGIAVVAGEVARARRPGRNLAGEARDELEFSHAPARLVPAPPGPDVLLRLGALSRVMLIAGALERALALSIEHAGSRRQFGRALAEFQVIQHQLALLAEEAAAVKCAWKAACRALADGDAEFEIAAAKTRANEAVALVASIAHQLHGAMGCTLEHPLQRATRRLWAWRTEFGNDRFWAGRLGREICAAGVQRFWPRIVGE